MNARLRAPRAALLLLAATLLLSASIAGIARAEDPSKAAGQYPAEPLAGQPVIVYYPAGGPGAGKASVEGSILINISAGVEVAKLPGCRGSAEIDVTVRLDNGEPASNALLLVESASTGEVCSARASLNGYAAVRAGKPGEAFKVYAFYDADGDGLYEYVGSGSVGAAQPPTAIQKVEITASPVMKAIEEAFTGASSTELKMPFSVPMAPIGGYYVALMPGLPAFNTSLPDNLFKYILYKLDLYDLRGKVVKSIRVILDSRVEYNVLVDGKTVYSNSYRVKPLKPGAELADLPPLVLAFAGKLQLAAGLRGEEALGLSPRGWSYPGFRPLPVTVIAVDDRGLSGIGLYVSVNGGDWVRLGLSDYPGTSALLAGMRRQCGSLVFLVNKFLEGFSSILAPLARGSPYTTCPDVKAMYGEIPGQPPGSYVLFRAEASDESHKGLNSVTSPAGLYYVYNSDSDKTVLVVDPSVPLWLAKYNAARLALLAGSSLARGLPFLSAYLEEALSLLNASSRLAPLLVFHHWEYVGARYRLVVVTSIDELPEALDEYKPDAIILSNLWPGLSATGSSVLDWDLRDHPRAWRALVNYIEENHAGLIATHATLSDLVVWLGDGRRVKVMARGHAGYTLSDSLDSGSLAAMLGLRLIPVYEQLRDTVAETLLQYGSGDSLLAALGLLLGSTPLLYPWVPWDGRLVATDAAKQMGWRVPDEPVVVPNPYMEANASIKAYTLVGWQLGLPQAGGWTVLKLLPRLVGESRAYYQLLDSLVANITGRMAPAWRGVEDAASRGLPLLRSALANTSIVDGEARIALRLRAASKTLQLGLPAGLSGELAEQLLPSPPASLVAVSPDGLAGIVAYDRYRDREHWYRSVYFSFEVEAGSNDAARTLLLEALDWAMKPRRPGAGEEVKSAAEEILGELEKYVKGIDSSAGLVASNFILASPGGSTLDYTLGPGTYYIAVKSSGGVEVELEGAATARVEQPAAGVKILTVEAKEEAGARLVIRGSPGPVAVALYRAGTAAKAGSGSRQPAGPSKPLARGSISVSYTLYSDHAELVYSVKPGTYYILVEGPPGARIKVSGAPASDYGEILPGLRVLAVEAPAAARIELAVAGPPGSTLSVTLVGLEAGPAGAVATLTVTLSLAYYPG